MKKEIKELLEKYSKRFGDSPKYQDYLSIANGSESESTETFLRMSMNEDILMDITSKYWENNPEEKAQVQSDIYKCTKHQNVILNDFKKAVTDLLKPFKPEVYATPNYEVTVLVESDYSVGMMTVRKSYQFNKNKEYDFIDKSNISIKNQEKDKFVELSKKYLNDATEIHNEKKKLVKYYWNPTEYKF